MKLSPRYGGSPMISIDGRWDDQLAPVARQRRRFETMLAGLGPDDWQAPSRCEAWTMLDVVAHLIGVNAFWQASVVAGLAGSPTRMLEAFDPAATPPLMVEPLRTLPPAAILEQFVASNDGFLGAINGLDEAGSMTLAESPPGHVPIRLLLHHALWDCWIHERDVGLPLGLTPATETDEVVSCLRYAAALSPALALSLGNGMGIGAPVTLGVEVTGLEVRFVLDVTEAVAVRDQLPVAGVAVLRGDAVTLVEALSLRVPLPTDAPDAWRSVLAGLAIAFDADPSSL